MNFTKSSGKSLTLKNFRSLPCVISIVLLSALGLLFLKEGHVETVVFNKQFNTLFLKRYSVFSTAKVTVLPLGAIEEVYGVRRGVIKGPNDMSYYALIVRTKKNQQIKILESSKKRKVIKEVSQASPTFTLD